MPYGKKLTWTGDLATILACVALIGSAVWLSASRHECVASCERAEAVNDAYMRGFRAGQLEGIQESIERIEAATASVSNKTRQP